MTRLVATVVTLAVIGGTSVAFAVTEKLKLERAPIGAARFEPAARRFSPVCRCATGTMRLSYTFRKPETVDVTVVDSAGKTVRSLVAGRRLSRGRHGFVWDGRNDTGVRLPDGAYQLRIRFLRERRSILTPIVFRIDTKRPRIRGASVSTAVVSPDGDHRNDKVLITYRTNEKASAELVVDGKAVARTRGRAPKRRQTLYWDGTLPSEAGGRIPAHRGEHEVVLRVRDLAGNEARRRFAVRVRFIELTHSTYQVAPGATLEFTVDTDAESYRWYLFRPHGGKLGRPVLYDEAASSRTVRARLPADAKPGTYILRVAEDGHRARATVAVMRSAV